MQLIFESLAELKAFVASFQGDEAAAAIKSTTPKKRGPKPGAKKAAAKTTTTKAKAKPGPKPKAEKAKPGPKPKAAKAKPGPKPKATKAAAKTTTKAKAKPGPKPKATKAAAKKPAAKKTGISLTDLIKGSIDGFVSKKQSFTANSIYDDLVKKNPKVNKQSVITSVLKQMNSTYSSMDRGEQAGNGPRAVKVYYPKGAKKAS